MSDRFLAASRTLGSVASEHKAVLVAYSGGKDSLAVLDLCARSFRRVVCFFMYFVPGLECVETQLDYARRKWGVEIIQYPHWVFCRCIKHGAYRTPGRLDAALMDVKLADVYALARADSGLDIIATGAKRSDGIWRRRNMAQTAHHADIIYPIKAWNKFDVLAYLKTHDIPIPDSSGRSATGIDLSTPSLLWLHDNYPEDFRRLCEYFPFAEAAIWRRQWHGVQ